MDERNDLVGFGSSWLKRSVTVGEGTWKRDTSISETDPGSVAKLLLLYLYLPALLILLFIPPIMHVYGFMPPVPVLYTTYDLW